MAKSAELISTFSWHELVTPEFLRRLKLAASVAEATSVAGLVESVAKVLRSTGHLSIICGDTSDERRTVLALEMFAASCLHLIHEAGITRVGPGCRPESENTGPSDYLVEHERVAINVASEAALAKVPGVSVSLARHIVGERESDGPFVSASDLVRRVSPLSKMSMRFLTAAFSYVSPAKVAQQIEVSQLNFDGAVNQALLLTPPGSQSERILALCNILTTTAARDRAIAMVNQPLGRHPSGDYQPEWRLADEIRVLERAAYYRAIGELIDAAEKSIDVTMFHIALPDPDHPTRALLDGLVRARKRGLAVRVMLDRDRPRDPYRSTVINRAAHRYLSAGNVECRWDRSDKLLHSKVVIMDLRLVIIGSHNWSAGSYFRDDDVSFQVVSAEVARDYGDRFDVLWERADPKREADGRRRLQEMGTQLVKPSG